MDQARIAGFVAWAGVFVAVLCGVAGWHMWRMPAKGVAEMGSVSTPALFRITQSEEVWPKIREAKIDPPDVHVGDVQRLTVTVESPEPIVAVEARIELDHGVKTVALQREEKEKGIYSAEWEVYDTHDATYRTTFIARDAAGRESSVTLAWSDACGIPMEGDWNLETDHGGPCTISSDDGVEDGNAIIGGHMLTVRSGSAFAWNPGYHLSISDGGSIAIEEGAILTEGYVWAFDFDGDGYVTELDVAAADPGLFWDRRSSGNAIGDCDPENGDVFQTLFLHTDRNQDHYQDNYYGGYNEGAYCVGGSILVGGVEYYRGVDASCNLPATGYYFAVSVSGYDTRSCPPP